MSLSNNKRLAKNTVFLYIRMFITMAVYLYTSRATLEILGVSDFGLYNLVAGTITMFSFVNSAMGGCTQRYLNISLGEGISVKTKTIFKNAYTIHVLLAILFAIVFYFIGNYLIDFYLKIDSGREDAAHSVFIFSLIAICISFISVPFDAALIAHEKMDFYAFVSIFDGVIKLGAVFLLYLFKNIDSVILYSILYGICNLLILSVYVTYTVRNFSECSLALGLDKNIVKDMGGFLGWSLLGNLAFMLAGQGKNIVFNMFFGTVINAAWGLATQVNSAYSKFSSSFQVAASPQIMKYYAQNEFSSMFVLTKNTSKYVGYLLLLIGIPLYIEIDYVLSLWLSVVPAYTSFFVRIMIIQTTLTAMCFPLTRVLQAVGVLKPSCIFTVIIEALNLSLTFFLLKIDISLEFVMEFQILSNIISFAYFLYLIKKYAHVNAIEYLPDVFSKIFIVLITSIIFPLLAHYSFNTTLIRLIAVCFASSISVFVSVFYLGIDKCTQMKIKDYIMKIINKTI